MGDKPFIGRRTIDESLDSRFCPNCGTLLAHEGFMWRCGNCERKGIEIRL